MEVAVILLAAGRGSRMGLNLPKQYLIWDGRTLLRHCLEHLAMEVRIRYVQPVIAKGDERYEASIKSFAPPYELAPPVVGGAHRAKSMCHGLAAIPKRYAWIAVHDAARPFPSPKLLGRVFDAAKRHGAAIPGIPVQDTIKRIEVDGMVVETLDRSCLRAVQTPQVAKRDWFEQAVERLQGRLSEFTDDAAVLEAAGFPVFVCQGERGNLKITHPEDLKLLPIFQGMGMRDEREEDLC